MPHRFSFPPSFLLRSATSPVDVAMEDAGTPKNPLKRPFPDDDATTHEDSSQEEEVEVQTARARLANVIKRHEVLSERLSRDSDKLISELLQKEFEAARTVQTEEIYLEGDQWNEGLLASLRERVHKEADRKAMQGHKILVGESHLLEKTFFRIRNKAILVLGAARIGIQYETFFVGEPCEIFYCVLESKNFLEKMTVIEHNVPFFLPIREAENSLLTMYAAIPFIDYVGEVLQSYVDRREQVRLIRELYGNQIGEIYNSLAFDRVEFTMANLSCKLTVSLRYVDHISVLPSKVRVLAWPVHSSKKNVSTEALTPRKGYETTLAPSVLIPLPFAEDALRTMSLPEAYADIVLNLPNALEQMFPQHECGTSENDLSSAGKSVDLLMS